MLDYKFIKENVEAVKQNIKNRHMNADADKAVELYDKRTALVTSLQNLQKDRNDNSQSMKQKLSPEERQKLVDQGKAIKEKIAQVEADLAEAEKALHEAVSKIPNMAHPEAPIGKEDSDNLEVKRSGTVPKFDFEPKDHVQLGQDLDLIDFEAGTKVSGVKFYFLN